MAKKSKRHRAFKHFMERGSRAVYEIKEDALCGGCKYHRPDWEYRFCRYIKCPEMKGALTYREEYYKEYIF